MDSLIELIDNRIENAMSKSTYVNSLIGQITSVGDSRCGVKLFTTGVVYNLPNYSGSDVVVGEKVYVYYAGGFLSNQTAYIGASLNKATKITYIEGSNTLGNLSSNPKKVSTIYFLVTAPTTINLVFNATIEAQTTDTATFAIIIDDNEYDYVPTMNINDGYTSCTFTVPVSFEDVGVHQIDIKATGVGAVTQVKSYIFGVGITKSDWIVTSDADYTYMIDMVDPTGERSLRYIANYDKIITPTTLDGNPFLSIGYETFMTKDVTAVDIQPPVTTIE